MIGQSVWHGQSAVMVVSMQGQLRRVPTTCNVTDSLCLSTAMLQHDDVPPPT
jgi:hypothetical protein